MDRGLGAELPVAQIDQGSNRARCNPEENKEEQGAEEKGREPQGRSTAIALNIVDPAESFIDDFRTENLGGWPIGNLAPSHNQALIAHFGCDPIVMG